MKKNVSGQIVGIQMVSATDGSAFTGSVTVYVTGDAGTQAAGSVGSGACTHEGNGYHTYAPAQAETNYDLVAFTFTGTGAISSTLQVYTLPTTGILSPATAGRTLVVDADGLADTNVVKMGPTGSGTAQTARDIGASVLLSSGTGTGQLDFTGGIVKGNVTQLLGTAWLTPGTAGTPDVNVKLWNGLVTVALPLVPTVAGRTLDVSTGGEAGIDWANVGSPASTVSFTGTTIGMVLLADTVTTLTNLPTITTNWLTAAGLAADAGVEIAAAVWDRVLNAANHNIASSAGRRVRQLDASSILSGTAAAGSANSITLDGSASATDEIYDGNLLVITGGTGAGQTRIIVEYNGMTKLATVNRVWEVTPSTDSTYDLIAAEQANISQHGLAQGGTASTITLSATASSVDDIYIGSYIYLSTSTGAGQTRLIADYVGSTKVVTVSPNWAVNPTSTSVYNIIPAGRVIADSGTVTTVAADAITAASIATDAGTEIANAVLAAGDVDGYSLEQTLKLCLASLAGKVSGAETATITIRAADDSRDRVTATVTAAGNRTAVTLDATG